MPLTSHGTLTGTDVTSVTISDAISIRVLNRAADGGGDMWVTRSDDGSTPDDPVAAADDTFFLPPGGFVEFSTGSSSRSAAWVVKLKGNGNAYSVEGDV